MDTITATATNQFELIHPGYSDPDGLDRMYTRGAPQAWASGHEDATYDHDAERWEVGIAVEGDEDVAPYHEAIEAAGLNLITSTPEGWIVEVTP